MSQILFRVQRCDYGEGADIRIALKTDAGNLGIAQPMELVMRGPDDDVSAYSPPAIHLENFSDLQGLMDQLWLAGVRPSDIGTAGHLAATQAHLNDMRVIVSKQLEVTFFK